MPVMDGLQLMKQIPVILFTSRASRKDVVEALDVGVDGYLTKPFTASQLQEQLQSVLERRTQRRVTQIVEGLDPLRREDDHALMLAGDAAASSQLMQPEHAAVVGTMAHTVNAVGDMDETAWMTTTLRTNFARWRSIATPSFRVSVTAICIPKRKFRTITAYLSRTCWGLPGSRTTSANSCCCLSATVPWLKLGDRLQVHLERGVLATCGGLHGVTRHENQSTPHDGCRAVKRVSE